MNAYIVIFFGMFVNTCMCRVLPADMQTCIYTYTATSGKTCGFCPMGSYKVGDCAFDGNMAECRLCGKNTFQPKCNNDTSCRSCKPQCPYPHMDIVWQCSHSHDLVCKCSDGYKWISATYSPGEGLCLKDKDCPAGQGYHAADNKCMPCIKGQTFSTSTSAGPCEMCTVCTTEYNSTCTVNQDADCILSTSKQKTTTNNQGMSEEAIGLVITVSVLTVALSALGFAAWYRGWCPRILACRNRTQNTEQTMNLEAYVSTLPTTVNRTSTDVSMANIQDNRTVQNGVDDRTMTNGVDNRTIVNGIDNRTMANGVYNKTIAIVSDNKTIGNGQDNRTVKREIENKTMANGLEYGTYAAFSVDLPDSDGDITTDRTDDVTPSDDIRDRYVAIRTDTGSNCGSPAFEVPYGNDIGASAIDGQNEEDDNGLNKNDNGRADQADIHTNNTNITLVGESENNSITKGSNETMTNVNTTNYESKDNKDMAFITYKPSMNADTSRELTGALAGNAGNEDDTRKHDTNKTDNKINSDTSVYDLEMDAETYTTDTQRHRDWRSINTFLAKNMDWNQHKTLIRSLVPGEYTNVEVWIRDVEADHDGSYEHRFQLFLKWKETFPTGSVDDIKNALSASELNGVLNNFEDFLKTPKSRLRPRKVVDKTKDTQSCPIISQETTQKSGFKLCILANGRQGLEELNEPVVKASTGGHLMTGLEEPAMNELKETFVTTNTDEQVMEELK